MLKSGDRTVRHLSKDYMSGEHYFISVHLENLGSVCFGPILLEPELTLSYRDETYKSFSHNGPHRNATAWSLCKRLGDRSIAAHQLHISGVFTYPRRSCIPVWSVLFVSYNHLIHIRIVFTSGTSSLRGITNLRRKPHCVSFVDLLLSNYARTDNPRSSTILTSMATKMGSTTNHNKAAFIHLTLPWHWLRQKGLYNGAPFNCLVRSSAPCIIAMFCGGRRAGDLTIQSISWTEL